LTHAGSVRRIPNEDSHVSNRKLDELSSDVEDATRIVDELQDAPGVNTKDKLEELSETLEHATDSIDELEERTR